jgi:hypothetical protein
MSELPTPTETVDVDRRTCSKCGTRWSGVDAPQDCPECGSPSMDSRAADAKDNTPPWAIEAIQYDERKRLAALLEESADTIAGFASDAPSAIRMVAYMLTLKQ